MENLALTPNFFKRLFAVPKSSAIKRVPPFLRKTFTSLASSDEKLTSGPMIISTPLSLLNPTELYGYITGMISPLSAKSFANSEQPSHLVLNMLNSADVFITGTARGRTRRIIPMKTRKAYIILILSPPISR